MIVRAIFYPKWNVELVILCVQILPEDDILKPNHVGFGTYDYFTIYISLSAFVG